MQLEQGVHDLVGHALQEARSANPWLTERGHLGDHVSVDSLAALAASMARTLKSGAEMPEGASREEMEMAQMEHDHQQVLVQRLPHQNLPRAPGRAWHVIIIVFRVRTAQA